MATTIKMPQLGESVTEGTIERWLVKEGDTVEQYDPLFEVVTDKVNAEVPAEVAGTISKILIGDGETVAVGTAVAEIETDGAGAAAEAPAAEPAPQAEQPAQAEATASAGAEAVAQQEEGPSQAPAAETPSAEAAPPAAAPAAAETPQAQPTGEPVTGEGTARMTPAVRRLVREHGIDVSQLAGSGAGGRVTREDVLAFIEKGAVSPAPAAEAPSAPQAQPPAAAPAPAAASAPQAQPQAAPAAPPPAAAPKPMAVPAPTGGDVEVPLSQMRKGIARKMTQVKQTVPHAYTVVEVDMSNVVKWREANNMAFKAREGASLSYVAVVIKAVTETLRKHPTLNSQFAEDKIILKQAMNIGIAVAVDNGLIVPVIANADQLSVSGVNAKIRDLSSRAHANKLRLDELQGGTFTVNNTGWFGSVTSMPIVNAPEVAILSMEAIVKRARVVELDGEDIIAIRPMMNMVCSFDHRVLDGAQVGFFLADVRKALEEWDINTSVG
ncbi:MAG TPA: dihydrolipoamide acetyltransferase family protein [Candidatus Limnocylindria bacterium]|nr:dihydrolipoamide acetyltransferase family protein [Candidatus Limnocylindria bacterium]